KPPWMAFRGEQSKHQKIVRCVRTSSLTAVLLMGPLHL
ncbi:PRDM7 isoform 2, partial [Pan troglodytes]